MDFVLKSAAGSTQPAELGAGGMTFVCVDVFDVQVEVS